MARKRRKRAAGDDDVPTSPRTTTDARVAAADGFDAKATVGATIRALLSSGERSSESTLFLRCATDADDAYDERVTHGAVWSHAASIVDALKPILARARARTPARRDRDGRALPPLVGVYADPSAEYVAALIAILACEAAFVPLDPGWSTPRLRAVVKSARVDGVIVLRAPRDEACDVFAPTSMPAANVATFTTRAPKSVTKAKARAAAATLASAAEGDDVVLSDVCYVMYTSGSTGTPKGVLGTHRGVLARAAWELPRAPDEGRERGCLSTAVGFVDSVNEIFAPLLRGRVSVVVNWEYTSYEAAMCKFLCDEDVETMTTRDVTFRFFTRGGGDGDARFKATTLAKAVVNGRVTRVTVTASMWTMLLRNLQMVLQMGDYPVDHLQLCTVVSSGEPLQITKLQWWSFWEENELYDVADGKGPTVYNLYGSTEVSGDALGCGFYCSRSSDVHSFDKFMQFGRDDDNFEAEMTSFNGGELPEEAPVGYPMRMGECSIVLLMKKDEETNGWFVVKEMNETGEVVVAGDCVAAGYLPADGDDKDDEDDERFTTLGALFGDGLPDKNAAGIRAFSTGDLGMFKQYSTGRGGACITLQGRSDDIVKVFGERVSLREVEAAASSVDGVERAVAKFFRAIDEGEWNDEGDWDEGWDIGGLVALYIVVRGRTRGNSDAMSRRVIEACRARGVPRIATPTMNAITTLDSLPMTASGKVDNAALPFPDLARALNFKIGEVNTADEVLEMMRKILGDDKYGMLDDFFEFGAASPDAAALAHMLRIDALKVYDLRRADAIAAFLKADLAIGMREKPEKPSWASDSDEDDDDGSYDSSWEEVDEPPPPGAAHTTIEDAKPLRHVWDAKLGRCVDARLLVFRVAGESGDGTWRVVIGSHSAEVVCARAFDGEVLWRTNLPGRVEAGACVADAKNTVVAVPCLDGHVYFIAVADGEILWSYDTGGECKGELTGYRRKPEDIQIVGSNDPNDENLTRDYLVFGMSHGGAAFALSHSKRRAIWSLSALGKGLGPDGEGEFHVKNFVGVAAPCVCVHGEVDREGWRNTSNDCVVFATLAGVVVAVSLDVVFKCAAPEYWEKKPKDAVRWAVGAHWSDFEDGGDFVPVFSSPVFLKHTGIVAVANVDGVIEGFPTEHGFGGRPEDPHAAHAWKIETGAPIYAPLASMEEFGNGFSVRNMLIVATAHGSLIGYLCDDGEGSEDHYGYADNPYEDYSDGGYHTFEDPDEIWRVQRKGRIRAAPAFLAPGYENHLLMDIVAAWDTGEVGVVTFDEGGVAKLRAIETLPAAVFSSPAPIAFRGGDRFVERIYIGCRDDKLHALEVPDRKE